MSGRRREGSTRRHTQPKRKLATRILIVCGGIRAEKHYFEGLRRVERNPAVAIRIKAERGSPTQIVEYAHEQDHLAEDEHDQVWAVVDVDDFTDLPQASALARKKSISLAVSNPCFELWLLLHLQDYRRSNATAHLLRDIKAICPHYDKTRLRFDDFQHGIADACTRARRLEPTGEAHGYNPSTNLWRLVEQLHR